MNKDNTNLAPGAPKYYAAALAVLLAAAWSIPNVSAQSEPDVFELSPFVVDGSQDEGYRARNSLSGSRLAAPLRDIPAQISVMTKELIDDVSGSGPEDMYRYSLNVEGPDEFQPLGEQSDYDAGNITNLTPGRIRGASPAARTVNYFDSHIYHDSYNIERITVHAGPNAVLYGLGAPGGIIDTTLKRASASRNFGEVSLRLDDNGSHRATFDYNYVISEGVAAIRFAAVEADEEYTISPAFNKYDRQYINFALNPTENTEVKLYYERGEIDRAPPPNNVFYDGTYEWRTGTGDWASYGPMHIWDNSASGGEPLPIGAMNRGGWPPILNVNAMSEQNISSYQTVLPWANDPAFVNRFAESVNPDSPVSVIPSDLNIRGLGTRMVQDHRLYGLEINQSIGDLNIQLAHFNEESDTYNANAFGEGNVGALRVDVAQYLDDGVTPNPNAGKYFANGLMRSRQYVDQIESSRLTATYNLDLREQNAGNHTFTALYALHDTMDTRETTDVGVMDAGLDDATALGNFQFGTSGRKTMHRYYFDTDASGLISGAAEFPFDTIYGGEVMIDGQRKHMHTAAFPGISGFGPTYNENERSSYMLALQSKFMEDNLILTTGYRSTSVDRAIRLDGGSPAIHGWPFLTWDNPNADLNAKPELYGVSSESGSQSMVGGVYHINDVFSVFANHANTWDSPTNVHRTDDSLVGSSTGNGTDFGFNARLLDDRINVRVNFFETKIFDTPEPQFQAEVLWEVWFAENYMTRTGWLGSVVQQNGAVRDIWLDANNYRPLNPNGGGTVPLPERASVVPGDTTGQHVAFNNNPTPDYLLLSSDAVTKGMEIEVTANLSENWQFQWNFTTADATSTNIGLDVVDYIDQRAAEWHKFYLFEEAIRQDPNPIFDDYNGSSVRIPANAVNNFTDRIHKLIANSITMRDSEGRSTPLNPDWRSNFIGRYNFGPDSGFDGMYLGGAVRARGERTVSYRGKEIAHPYPEFGEARLVVPDVTQPIVEGSTLDFDMFAGYRMPLANDSMSLKIQLNVRNVFDETDPVVQRFDLSGVPKHHYRPEGRSFLLTTSLGF